MLHCYVLQPCGMQWCLENVPVLPMLALSSREKTAPSFWSSIKGAVVCVVPCFPACILWVRDSLYHLTVNHLRNTDLGMGRIMFFVSVWLTFLAVHFQAWFPANAVVSEAVAWWMGGGCVGLCLRSVQNQPDHHVTLVLKLSTSTDKETQNGVM